jgi:hypothetical protein
MALAVHLDERRVDMLVITSDGTTVAIECENGTMLSVQRHIAKISQDCPEIATWKGSQIAARPSISRSKRSYEIAAAIDAAVSEGWPARP